MRRVESWKSLLVVAYKVWWSRGQRAKGQGEDSLESQNYTCECSILRLRDANRNEHFLGCLVDSGHLAI